MLRGLFGSSARQAGVTDGGAFLAQADPRLDDPISRTMGRSVMRRAPVMAPEEARQTPQGADRLAILGATLQDVGVGIRGGQGGALERVQAGYRARAEKDQAAQLRQQMQDLAASLYGDDPEAQLLFMADPEAFVGARAERLKPRVMKGGDIYIDPATGQRFAAPMVEKMDDRFAFVDPDDQSVRYSEARGPTYQESTGRMGVEETGRHNKVTEKLGFGNLGVAQGNLGVRQREFEERRRQGGFGTPGMAGQWEEF